MTDRELQESLRVGVSRDAGQRRKRPGRRIPVALAGQAELAELIRAGAQMANLCHNLSQPDWAFEERHRNEMRDLYRAWDEALNRARRKE